MANDPIKHSPPDFNINTVKGWNTRLLYNFYGDFNQVFDYYNVAGNYTDNLFDTIPTYESSQTYKASKGQYVFPPRYFKTGKSVRIRGRFLVTSQATGIFNIKISIDNSTDGTTPLAAQNNFNNHEFAESAAKTDVPVDFEILLTSIESDNPYLYIQANGYYEYAYNDYNSIGNNRANVYVPIWNSTQYKLVETTLTGTNELYISFNDSSNIDNIKLYHMTVEELS